MRGIAHTLAGLAGLAAVAALPAPAPAADAIAVGKAFLTRYIELSNSYAVGLANLYADDASITAVVRMPDETTREVQVTGAQLKRVMPALVAEARRQKTRENFSDIRYTDEGGRIRITALHHMLHDGRRAPHVFVIAPAEGGRWVIVSESGQMRIEPARPEPARPEAEGGEATPAEAAPVAGPGAEPPA